MTETLEQPAPEKSSAAGDEEMFATRLIPQVARLLRDEIQISGERIHESL
jgi:hypothetical protein